MPRWENTDCTPWTLRDRLGLLLAIALVLTSCGQKTDVPRESEVDSAQSTTAPPDSAKKSDRSVGEHPLPDHVLQFCASQEQSARDLAKRADVPPPDDVWRYFEAAKVGDVVQADETYDCLVMERGGNHPDTNFPYTVHQPMLEAQLAIEQFSLCGTKYAMTYGSNILAALPPGSVYLGNSDAGRGLPTVLARSSGKANSIVILSPAQMGNGGYRAYLRSIYGGKLNLPSEAEVEAAFDEYRQDARKRQGEGKLMQGEQVSVKDGETMVGGPTAYLEIAYRNVRLVQRSNPERDFFSQGSWVPAWMLPCLAPHGAVLRVHREPLPALSVEDLQESDAYWEREVSVLVGSWLKPETTVQQVCAFAEKVHLNQDLSGFSGDPEFVRNRQSGRNFADLRGDIARLYLWRIGSIQGMPTPTDYQVQAPEARREMQLRAEHALRQALALCPSCPVALFPYVGFLAADQRMEEAARLVSIAAKHDPENQMIHQMAKKLEMLRQP